MSKKKTVKVELTRRDFLVIAGTAVGSVAAAQVLTTWAALAFWQFEARSAGNWRKRPRRHQQPLPLGHGD